MESFKWTAQSMKVDCNMSHARVSKLIEDEEVFRVKSTFIERVTAAPTAI